MKQDEILERLKDIITTHIPEIMPPKVNTCWLDGNICPYGLPNGRFQDRPLQICHLGLGACPKLQTQEDVFADLMGSYVEEEVKKRINDTCQTNKITLSSELRVIAEQYDDDDKSLEQQTLKLAADIIEGNSHLNTEIIRTEDI